MSKLYCTVVKKEEWQMFIEKLYEVSDAHFKENSLFEMFLGTYNPFNSGFEEESCLGILIPLNSTGALAVQKFNSDFANHNFLDAIKFIQKCSELFPLKLSLTKENVWKLLHLYEIPNNIKDNIMNRLEDE